MEGSIHQSSNMLARVTSGRMPAAGQPPRPLLVRIELNLTRAGCTKRGWFPGAQASLKIGEVEGGYQAAGGEDFRTESVDAAIPSVFAT
jgi:hypothetical protein